MEKLPRIPTPPGVLLRELRIAVLPFVTFAVVLGLTVITWRRYTGPAVLVGEVEPVRAQITSPQGGRITALSVNLLDRVTAGQVVGEVLPVDPRWLLAQLDIRRMRINALRESLDSRVRQQNNEIAYVQLRMDWMEHRAELASLKAQQAFFRLELDRQERLAAGGGTNRLTSDGAGNPGFQTQLGGGVVNNGAPVLDRGANAVSDNYQSQRLASNQRPGQGLMVRDYSLSSGSPSRLNSVVEYEVARRDFDSLSAQIEERSRLVEDIERSLGRLVPEEAKLNEETPAALQSALRVEDLELNLLEQNMKPVPLVAAISGSVAGIFRRSGENVVAGELILTLSGDRPERVIAFARQPIQFELQTNMVVELRCRGRKRESGLGRVLAVGTQMEPILPQLLPRGTGSNTIEYGLPFLVSIPADFPALGGESVDLLFGPR